MQNQNQPKIKYFLYARKSSETEDKQAASIDDQINEMTKIARANKLKIVEILSESKSAKEPGRTVFNEMIERIEKGEANGILCWKLNRLARNPIDGGRISWMLQNKTIQQIYTNGRNYFPTDNVIIMAVELGMANQFIMDLSVDTKRGLRNKAELGWYPGVAKPGYMNEKYTDKGVKRVLVDHERFSLVQKAFQEMLKGVYSPYQVLKMLNEDWGYRSMQRKRLGNKPMASSAFYKILSDPFYYGIYEYPQDSGNWYKGKHEPMITEDEYLRIQSLIGKRDYPRPNQQNSCEAFYGVFRCGECDSAISPDEKIQTICSECKYKFASKHNHVCPKCKTHINKMKHPKHLRYLYYGCTKKKNPNCSQKGIRSNLLEQDISKILESLTISEDMKNWYIERLNESRKEKKFDRENITSSLQKNYDNCQKRMDNLFKLKISPQNTENNLLSDEEFGQQKLLIMEQMEAIEGRLKNTRESDEEWIEACVKTFKFACYAKYHFDNGNLETKKLILSGLGANLKLEGGKAVISLPKHLEIIKKANDEICELRIAPEPKNICLHNKKTSSLEPVFSSMLPGSDSNRRPID